MPAVAGHGVPAIFTRQIIFERSTPLQRVDAPTVCVLYRIGVNLGGGQDQGFARLGRDTPPTSPASVRSSSWMPTTSGGASKRMSGCSSTTYGPPDPPPHPRLHRRPLESDVRGYGRIALDRASNRLEHKEIRLIGSAPPHSYHQSRQSPPDRRRGPTGRSSRSSRADSRSTCALA